MTELRFESVLPLTGIRRGSMCAYTVAAREILICHTREGVFALDNICTHAHARMCEGWLKATRIVCPLHGASFDIRDGKVLGPPAELPLPSFPVRIVARMIEVAVSPASAGASISE
ncbi:MAG TPA: non-heme iron oxygenase ferredoxin subunit [Steroidobacteraceae bacterium]|nr:non-heme iron oxygenase ferredoxin subunit [Steroidobacteraceae bacterium]